MLALASLSTLDEGLDLAGFNLLPTIEALLVVPRSRRSKGEVSANVLMSDEQDVLVAKVDGRSQRRSSSEFDQVNVSISPITSSRSRQVGTIRLVLEHTAIECRWTQI